jgi:hypothetical protein
MKTIAPPCEVRFTLINGGAGRVQANSDPKFCYFQERMFEYPEIAATERMSLAGKGGAIKEVPNGLCCAERLECKRMALYQKSWLDRL